MYTCGITSFYNILHYFMYTVLYSCKVFPLLLANRTYKLNRMARMKQTHRNPNVDRPMMVVGSDIQSAEQRPTPKPTQGKVLHKGGKEPRKHLSKKLLHLGAPPTGGIKKPHHHRPRLVALHEIH